MIGHEGLIAGNAPQGSVMYAIPVGAGIAGDEALKSTTKTSYSYFLKVFK